MTFPTSNGSIHSTLRSQVAELLYCETDEVEDKVTFQDLGLDSVLATELITLINTEFGLSEKSEVIYQNPTLEELTTYISTKVSDKV